MSKALGPLVTPERSTEMMDPFHLGRAHLSLPALSVRVLRRLRFLCAAQVLCHRRRGLNLRWQRHGDDMT